MVETRAQMVKMKKGKKRGKTKTGKEESNERKKRKMRVESMKKNMNERYYH